MRSRYENRYCGPCLQTTRHVMEGYGPAAPLRCTRCERKKYPVQPRQPPTPTPLPQRTDR